MLKKPKYIFSETIFLKVFLEYLLFLFRTYKLFSNCYSGNHHCRVGCPNILNFTSTSNITGGILYRYILSPNPKFQNFISRIDRLPAFSVNCKIYIVKRHENGQKIIIFRKMGITFDWDVLSSWTLHCCVSFLVLSCWILIMAMLYYVWATLVHGHNSHNSHFRLLWPLWPWPLTFLTYP